MPRLSTTPTHTTHSIQDIPITNAAPGDLQIHHPVAGAGEVKHGNTSMFSKHLFSLPEPQQVESFVVGRGTFSECPTLKRNSHQKGWPWMIQT